MRTSGNHVQAALLRAIANVAFLSVHDRQKPILIVESACSLDWASATFVGATHKLDLRLDGDAAAVAAALALLLADLGDAEIPVAGQIVAEIAATPGVLAVFDTGNAAQSLCVRALTIID